MIINPLYIKIGLTVFIFIIIIVIIFVIRSLIRSNILYDNPTTVINPVHNTSFQNPCTKIRTPCDPHNPDCTTPCTEEELVCTNLHEMNPIGGSAINGGGFVCLPEIPSDNKCNSSKGGVRVWTGYGFTENEDWSCYCSYPEYFTGVSCDDTTPDFCTGGTIDTSKLDGTVKPSGDICNCPSNTKKLYRSNTNVPYCVSTDPAKGGGEFGLAGNLPSSPDWSIVYFRQVKGNNTYESLNDWAKRISIQISKENPPLNGVITNIINILQNSETWIKTQGQTNLTSLGSLSDTTKSQTVADAICNAAASCSTLCSYMCSCAPGNNRAINFPTNYATYTYMKGDYLPPHAC